jgi:dihydropyrimidine dehydrogenase (NAD+) subunit PreT
VKFASASGEEFVVDCDQVIKATGQAKSGGLFELIADLDLDENQRVKVNSDSNQSSNPKYFAGGDAINGGAEVVNAAYDGKLAANGILAYLTNKK